ncbi:MAG: glycosyltransferase [Acidobacteria bacterium]|nr:glycosyltransferase [Acidobacteriota bacterium]
MKPTILFLSEHGSPAAEDPQLESCLEALGNDYQLLVVVPSGELMGAELKARGILTASCRWGEGGAWSSLRQSPGAARELGRLVERHSVRLIYVAGPGPLPAAGLAAGYTRRPLVFYLQRPLEGRMETFITAKFAGLAERILVASQDLREILLRSSSKLHAKIEVFDVNSAPAEHAGRLRELVKKLVG